MKISLFFLVLSLFTSYASAATEADLVGSPMATKKTFARGKSALSDLKEAGAKSEQGINPSRLNMVYTLIADQGENFTHYKKDSFGLFFVNTPTKKELNKLAKKYSISFPKKCDMQTNPNCYANLHSKKKVEDTMKRILSSEANVRVVSFDYIEE
mgnify:CR=1 FL=1